MCIVLPFRVYKVLSHSLSYLILIPTLKERYSGNCFFRFLYEKIRYSKRLSGLFTERQYKLVPGVQLISFISESSVLFIISIQSNIFSSNFPVWRYKLLRVPLGRLLCWAAARVISNSFGGVIKQVKDSFFICSGLSVCVWQGGWLRSGVWRLYFSQSL